MGDNGINHTGDPTGIHKIDAKDKESLIRDLAAFGKPFELAKQYNINITAVAYYVKKYADVIKQSRRKWVSRLDNEQYSHKRSRIIKLTELIDIVESRVITDMSISPNVLLIAVQRIESLIDKLRVELEGNKVTLAGGFTVTVQDSDLMSKASEILSGRVNGQITE
ncbi:MAG: hypothetical protein ACUZ8H_15825 [Candidatus Anammoxibacter sp.]